MNSYGFSYLRNRSRSVIKRIEKSRRFQLRKRLMRVFGMSKEAAKELANDYRYEREVTPCERCGRKRGGACWHVDCPRHESRGRA